MSGRDWARMLALDPNPHDCDLRPWRTCPHCMGSGESRLMVDGNYVCTSCHGSGFVNRTGYWSSPPGYTNRLPVFISPSWPLAIEDASKLARSSGARYRISSFGGSWRVLRCVAPERRKASDAGPPLVTAPNVSDLRL